MLANSIFFPFSPLRFLTFKRQVHLLRHMYNLFMYKILVFGAVFDSMVSRPGGSGVSVSDSGPGGCEFDPRLRRLFFPGYFRLSPLQKHVREVVGGFWKEKLC